MPLKASSYNVLFIGAQALVDNGILDENIDPKMIMPVIKLVQDQQLQEILGTPMLVYLQDGITNNSLTTDDQFLLQGYIEPVLIWYCTYELSFFNSFKIKIKGLEKMSGENSSAASLSEIQSFQNKTKERAEFYADRLLKYMEGYPNLFPAFWNASIHLGDIIPNRRTGYQSSMYLGNDRPYNGRYGRCGFGEDFFEWY
jgi:hypothetical protein